MPPPPKRRLDVRLLADGLADDESEARALVMRGGVLVNGKPVLTPGAQVKDSDAVALKNSAKEGHPWVSRGGCKLDHALTAFDLDVAGAVAADIGASTGGFTDVLLHRGAKRVYAVDVGYGELAWKIRQDGRVVVLDRTNARLLPDGAVPEPLDAVVCDVSFISVTLALSRVLRLLKPDGLLVTLVKPQFESGREEATEGGGIISDASVHVACCLRICDWTEGQGFRILGMCRSPIKGRKGNAEFLLAARKTGK